MTKRQPHKQVTCSVGVPPGMLPQPGSPILQSTMPTTGKQFDFLALEVFRRAVEDGLVPEYAKLTGRAQIKAARALTRGLLADQLVRAYRSQRQTITDTVGVVKELGGRGRGVTVRQVADALRLDISSVRRRLRKAVSDGWILNHDTQTKQGRGIRGRYSVSGEKISDRSDLLPSVRDLEREYAVANADDCEVLADDAKRLGLKHHCLICKRHLDSTPSCVAERDLHARLLNYLNYRFRLIEALENLCVDCLVHSLKLFDRSLKLCNGREHYYDENLKKWFFKNKSYNPATGDVIELAVLDLLRRKPALPIHSVTPRDFTRRTIMFNVAMRGHRFYDDHRRLSKRRFKSVASLYEYVAVARHYRKKFGLKGRVCNPTDMPPAQLRQWLNGGCLYTRINNTRNLLDQIKGWPLGCAFRATRVHLAQYRSAIEETLKGRWGCGYAWLRKLVYLEGTARNFPLEFRRRMYALEKRELSRDGSRDIPIDELGVEYLLGMARDYENCLRSAREDAKRFYA